MHHRIEHGGFGNLGDSMRRLLLAAGLLVPLAASADPFVFQPVTGGVGGIGTVTSITPGEGVSSGSDCAVTAITSSGTLSANCRNINEQTDTAHTIASGDCGKLVVLNSGSAFALTLPAASTLSKCEFGLSNIGAGNATITGTIDGVATRVMQRYQGMTLVSDGSVWRSRGVGPGVSVDGLVDPRLGSPGDLSEPRFRAGFEDEGGSRRCLGLVRVHRERV